MFIKGVYQEVYNGKEGQKVKVFSINDKNVEYSYNLDAKKPTALISIDSTREWYLVKADG